MTKSAFFDDSPRPSIRVERRYNHPPHRVWRAVTSPGSLAHWFPSEVEFDLDARTVTYDRHGESPSVGKVLDVDPPRRLVFTWEADRLEFTLRPDGDATVFVLTHAFDDKPGAASFASGWEQCLAGLRAVLAGEPQPTATRNVERHEELVGRFGLDRPQVTTGDGHWHVRFERQLTCSAAVAWDLFFGFDPATGEQRPAPAIDGEFRPYAAPEVLLGIATTVDPPHEFAFNCADDEPGDKVRLRFGQGTGHGARLILEVSGSAEDELDDAIETWGAGAIGHVAREAAWLSGDQIKRGVIGSDSTRTVVLTRTFDASVQDLWSACTDPQRLAAWFGPVIGDLQIGGRFTLRASGTQGVIERCVPPVSLRVTWEYGGAASVVDVTISERDRRAQLTLEHTTPDDDHWRSYGPCAVGLGWESALLALVLYLAGDERQSPTWMAKFLATRVGADYFHRSADAWAQADLANGADPDRARVAAQRAAGSYAGSQ